MTRRTRPVSFLATARNSSEAQCRFANPQAEPVPTTPGQSGGAMTSELARHQSVVKAAGARVAQAGRVCSGMSCWVAMLSSSLRVNPSAQLATA